MLRKYRLVLTAIIICITTFAVSDLAARDIKAPWEPLSLLPNGDVWSIVELNGDLFTAVRLSGVYKSSDGGNSWFRLTNVEAANVFELHVFGNNLFVAGAGVLLRSQDGGESWEDVSEGINKTAFWLITSIVSDDSVLYLTTLDGLYTSTNQGLTWEATDNSLPQDEYNYTSLNESTVFLGGTDNIVKYDRTTGSWNFIVTPILRPNFGLHVNGFLYASSSVGGETTELWRSVDEGQSWESAGSGLPTGTIFNDMVFSDGKYLLATSRGMFTSGSGDTWTALAPNSGELDVHRVLPRGNDLIVGTRGYGVFRLDSGADDFTSINKGIEFWWVLKAWLTDSRIFTSSAFVELHYRNYGIDGEWQPVNPTFDLDQAVYDIKQNGDEILIGTNSLFRSLDNGDSWTEHPAVDNWGAIHSILPVEGGTLCFTDTHIHTIDADGQATSVAYEFESSVSASVLHKGVLFVGTENSGNFRSDDGGRTWEAVSNGMLNANTRTFLSDGDVLLSGTAKGVYRSVDMGDSWQNVSGGNTINSSPIIGFGLLDDIMYMGSQFNIWYSTDQGINWLPLSLEGLPQDTWLSSLVMREDQLYLGTHRIGMFTAQIQDKPTGVAASEGLRNSVIGDLVVQFQNDGRNIDVSFSMNVNATAEYGVYDLRGRRITTGQTAHLNSGRQTISLHTPALESGVYIATLRVGDELVTRSFVVGR